MHVSVHVYIQCSVLLPVKVTWQRCVFLSSQIKIYSDLEAACHVEQHIYQSWSEEKHSRERVWQEHGVKPDNIHVGASRSVTSPLCRLFSAPLVYWEMSNTFQVRGFSDSVKECRTAVTCYPTEWPPSQCHPQPRLKSEIFRVRSWVCESVTASDNNAVLCFVFHFTLTEISTFLLFFKQCQRESSQQFISSWCCAGKLKVNKSLIWTETLTKCWWKHQAKEKNNIF